MMTESSTIPPPPGTTENPPLPPEPPSSPPPPLPPNTAPNNQPQNNWAQFYYSGYYHPQYAHYYQQYYMMQQGYNTYNQFTQFPDKKEDKIQPPLPPGPPLPSIPSNSPRPPLLSTPKQFGSIRFQLNGKRLPNNNAILQLNNSPNSGAAKKKRKRNRNNQNIQNQFNQTNNFGIPPLPPPELSLPKPAPPPETMPPEPPLPPLPEEMKPPEPVQEPPSCNSAPKGMANPSDDWPESLRTYVHQCYAKCKTNIDRNQVDIILKGKITQAYQNNQLHRDWSKEPLPTVHSERPPFTGQLKTVPGQLSQFQNLKKGISPGLGARLGARSNVLRKKSRSSSRSRSKSITCHIRFLYSFLTLSFRCSGSSDSSSDENFKPLTKSSKKNKGKLSDRLGPTKTKLAKSSKKQKAKEKKASFYSTFGSELEESTEVLQQRAARFNNGKQNGTGSASSPVNDNKKQGFIIDKFSEDNNSVDFDWSECHIVGTCHDLEKSFLRLTKAPDPCDVRPVEVLKLSLQNVKERWLAKQDYFYACDQLKSIRQDLTVSSDIMTIMKSLSAEEKSDECISFALKIRSAWGSGNFHKFFYLYRVAPLMTGYLIDWFIERERKSYLKCIIKSYRQNVSCTFVMQELAFKSAEECLEFLEPFSLSFVDSQRTFIDCKSSMAALPNI
nr:leukocyte receptor cluster member 8 homolog [Leptinotarsa decemlineata]